MFSAPFLDNRQRLAHFAGGLEVAKQQDGIGEITHIHGRIDIRSHEANLGNGHQRRDPFLAQERQQFVQLHGEKVFAWHGIEKSVQAVDDQQLEIVFFDQLPDFVDKLAGREFRGVDLAKQQFSGINVFFDIHAQAFRPDHQSRQSLIEGEERRTTTALDS